MMKDHRLLPRAGVSGMVHPKPSDEAAFVHRTGGFIINEEGTSIKRLMLLVAVLTLVVGAEGQAQGGLYISQEFVGLSDQGAYSVDTINQFFPLPPTPIRGGFTYSDDGTITTLSVYFGSAISSPYLNFDGDTFARITFSVSDTVRATFPSNPIDSELNIGPDGTLTFDFTAGEIKGPGSLFITSGGIGEAFRLTGTVDSSSISLYGFAGGEFAYIGGPLTQSAPEPSTLTLLGIGAVGLVSYGWRRWRQGA